MILTTELPRIIQTGDRADLKEWLANCSDADLMTNWIKLSNCRVQDFSELTQDTLLKRGLFQGM